MRLPSETVGAPGLPVLNVQPRRGQDYVIARMRVHRAMLHMLSPTPIPLWTKWPLMQDLFLRLWPIACADGLRMFVLRRMAWIVQKNP